MGSIHCKSHLDRAVKGHYVSKTLMTFKKNYCYDMYFNKQHENTGIAQILHSLKCHIEGCCRLKTAFELDIFSSGCRGSESDQNLSVMICSSTDKIL